MADNQDSKLPVEIQTLLHQTFSRTGRTFGAHDPEEAWISEELSEEEILTALNEAKRVKYFKNKEQRDAQAYRKWKQFWLGPWTPTDMENFITHRALTRYNFSTNGGADGRKVFKIDDHNRALISALCLYFTDNPGFEQLNSSWRLDKGLLILGSVGTGKTMLMKLLQINKKQCYVVRNSVDISREFAKKDDEGGYSIIRRFEGYCREVDNPPVKHVDNFFTENYGFCFDDTGIEDDKVNFGNKSNVMAEIIAARYSNPSLPRYMTHMTSNLGVEGIKARYGERVWSRMYEMFNVMPLMGPDRRRL